MLIEFPKVKNAYGEEFDFCAAVNLMDHDLCIECSNTSYNGETPQQFFDRYCAAHYKKFGEEFELAKENPVW